MWSWKKISCWDRQQHPSYLPGQAAYLLWMTEKNRYYSSLTCQTPGMSVHVHSKWAETSRHENLEIQGSTAQLCMQESWEALAPSGIKLLLPVWLPGSALAVWPVPNGCVASGPPEEVALGNTLPSCQCNLPSLQLALKLLQRKR